VFRAELNHYFSSLSPTFFSIFASLSPRKHHTPLLNRGATLHVPSQPPQRKLHGVSKDFFCCLLLSHQLLIKSLTKVALTSNI
jgi:hypothetical protein